MIDDDDQELEQRKTGIRTRRSRDSYEIPVPDVGIDTFAAFLAIRAVGEHVEVAALSRIGVLVGLIPRIDRDASAAAGFQFGALASPGFVTSASRPSAVLG